MAYHVVPLYYREAHASRSPGRFAEVIFRSFLSGRSLKHKKGQNGVRTIFLTGGRRRDSLAAKGQKGQKGNSLVRRPVRDALAAR